MSSSLASAFQQLEQTSWCNWEFFCSGKKVFPCSGRITRSRSSSLSWTGREPEFHGSSGRKSTQQYLMMHRKLPYLRQGSSRFRKELHIYICAVNSMDSSERENEMNHYNGWNTSAKTSDGFEVAMVTSTESTEPNCSTGLRVGVKVLVSRQPAELNVSVTCK